MTVTKAANAHTTVATGWSTPTNCYSTTNDSAYAILVCPKNATASGDFGFPAFTTSDIPDGSTINSVTFYTTYGVTVATTGALVGMQARRDSTGTTLGSEITRATASMADANAVATGCTLTDLRTANELRVRARATKGNSNTASTAQIDRLYVTVDFTPPPENHNGLLTATGGGVAAEAARKGGQWNGALTGGGVIVETQKGAHNEPLTATGAGILSWSYERSTAAENHDGAFVLTGGGIASVAHTAAHVVALGLTGGGTLAPAARTDRRTGVTATASGVAAQGQATARTGYSAATGGGIVALGASTGRRVGMTATASGASVASWTGAHAEAFTTTGGGAVVIIGTAETPPENHPGYLGVTGGGAATFAEWTNRAVLARLTGSGVAALGHMSDRAEAWRVTGGGTLGVSVGGDHVGGWTAAGSGQITVAGQGPVVVPGLPAHMTLSTAPVRLHVAAYSGAPTIVSERRVDS
jgi:hypothetical protein